MPSTPGVPTGRKHGTESAYQRGCHCLECRVAHRQYQAIQRKRKKAANA